MQGPLPSPPPTYQHDGCGPKLNWITGQYLRLLVPDLNLYLMCQWRQWRTSEDECKWFIAIRLILLKQSKIRQWDIWKWCHGTSLLFTYKMVIIHSNYVLCARWVHFVTPDSPSRLPCCSMRVLPPPLLVINCLSCSLHGGPGPPPFPPPGLTPFPSGSRHLPASSSDTHNNSFILVFLKLINFVVTPEGPCIQAEPRSKMISEVAVWILPASRLRCVYNDKRARWLILPVYTGLGWMYLWWLKWRLPGPPYIITIWGCIYND